MKPLFRTLFALSILFTSLTTTAQKITTPIQMNDYLASTTDTLYQCGGDWGTKFKEIRSSKKFSELATARRKIEKFIERKRLELVALKDISGSEKLRLAMIDFLAFEYKMIQEGFLPMEKMSPSTTDDEVQKAISNLSKLSEAENEFLKKVNDEQRAYAAKNGFTIDEAEDKDSQ